MEKIDKEMEAAKERLGLVYGEEIAGLAIEIFDRVITVETRTVGSGIRQGKLLAALLELFLTLDQAADDCANRHIEN